MMAVEDSDFGGIESPRPSWQRWLGWASAGALFAILISLVVMLSLSSRQRDKALEWQQRSFEVMIAVRAIEGQMAQSEATLGRSVVASNKNLAIQYYDEWRRAGQLITRLQRLTHTSPTQAALLTELQRLYQVRSDELNEAALHLNYDQKVKAISAYYGAGKTETLSRIKAIFREIITNEQAGIRSHSDEVKGFISRTNKLAATLSVLGLLLVMGAIGLGWTAIDAMAQRHRARRAAEFETNRAELLETAVTERTSELQLANQRLLAEASERAHAEAQLRQIQKMEAVGQLTGGIAHDFNNMLAVVVGGLELAKLKLPGGSCDAERHIDNAMEGANRAAALTRRLLAFARAEPLLPQAAAPDKLVVGMKDLMDRTLGERIHLAIEGDADPWRIWVDRHQLENAILNLAVNARDAMEASGGKLTIRTSQTHLMPGEIGESAGGDYVRIEVSDTGCGMSKQVLDRVFEPFFTTKAVGKGTGLGLSQIFGFVRQSGGEISITSAEGIGTTVSLFLPRHHADEDIEIHTIALPETPMAAPVAAAPAQSIRARVALVVEDDPRVLASTTGALTELGMTVIGCSSAEAAIEHLARDSGIDIIVTDVVMPGMTGPEFIAQIGPLYPHVAILFVTGYADVNDADAFCGHSVLRKPFTIAALENAVTTAIAKPSEPPPVRKAEAAE